MSQKRIGIDAIGGDEYKDVPVTLRVVHAVQKLAEITDETFVLVGDKPVLEKLVNRNLYGTVEIEHGVHEKYGALKRLAAMANEYQIDAFYTMENTIRVAAVVHHDIGLDERLTEKFPDPRNLTAPLIATVPKSPSVKRAQTLYLLDAGMTPSMSPDQAEFFAYVGALYAQRMGRERPIIGLLNIGSEEDKGGLLLRETHQRLRSSELLRPFGFMGNIEPHTYLNEMEKGTTTEQPVDVIVTDGKSGNQTLKDAAAYVKLAGDIFKYEIMHGTILEWIGAFLLKNVFARAKRRGDSNTYGCALIAGIEVPGFKSHGTTNIEGIITGLKQCIAYVQRKSYRVPAPSTSDKSFLTAS